MLSAGRMNVVDAVPARGERLSRMPPTGSTRPRQRDLAGHRHVFARRLVLIADRIAVAIVTPADGPSWESRRRARGCAGPGVRRSPRNAQRFGCSPVMWLTRRARRFLHHLAELAGQDHLLGAAGQQRGFDEQHVAAGFRPRNARGHAGPGRPEHRLAMEPRPAEIFGELRGIDDESAARRCQPRSRPAWRSEPPLCVRWRRAAARGHARPPRACIALITAPQRLVGRDPAHRRAGRALPSAAAAGSARDVTLLLLGVAGQRDDLHAVEQRRVHACRAGSPSR